MLLEALAERVLVYDGAMGTQIQGAGFSNEDFTLRPEARYSAKVRAAAERVGDKPLDGCNELLVLTRPETVERIHGAYLEAGADLIETNTFGATSIVLAEYGIAEMAYELNVKAAQLAKRVAGDYSTKNRQRWVAGSMGPGRNCRRSARLVFSTSKPRSVSKCVACLTAVLIC